MKSYKELYHNLFNAITDALDDLETGRIIAAIHRLKTAQQQAEEYVMEIDILPDISSTEMQKFPSER